MTHLILQVDARTRLLMLDNRQIHQINVVVQAIDGTSDGSGSSRTNVQAMDQGAVEGDIDGVQAMEGAMDGTSD